MTAFGRRKIVKEIALGGFALFAAGGHSRSAQAQEPNAAANPAHPIRRVVTGHDSKGRSVFLMDGPAPHIYQRAPQSSAVTELWITDAAPAKISGSADDSLQPFRLNPRPNGTSFRVVQYAPGQMRQAAQEKEISLGDDGSGLVKAISEGQTARAPGFHKTNSVDYCIILRGEIWALMDEGEKLLKQGDILIQRGTNHAWVNRTSEPCYVAFVLVDATPLA
jgi:hypothetical protein